MLAYMGVMADHRNDDQRTGAIREARMAEANLQRSEEQAWAQRR